MIQIGLLWGYQVKWFVYVGYCGGKVKWFDPDM